MSTPPSSKVSSAFKHRSSVVFPHPEDPTTATRSPDATSALTPPSVMRSPWRLRRFRMLITMETPFEAPGKAREGVAHGEVEGGAQNARDEPAPEIDRGDAHTLRQL